MSAKFNLGQVVGTPAVLEALGHFPLELLARHIEGDWGDLDDEDKAANDAALQHGGRLFSAYDVDGVRVWVITEADRSVTTILLPSDY